MGDFHLPSSNTRKQQVCHRFLSAHDSGRELGSYSHPEFQPMTFLKSVAAHVHGIITHHKQNSDNFHRPSFFCVVLFYLYFLK